MVAVMTKTVYTCVVRKEGAKWIIATDLPEVGIIEAEAELDWQIDRHARLSICDFTEDEPFDFDIHYEFIGDAPGYLIKN